MQKFTSANTSINSAKVPAVFKKIDWAKGEVNLDIGGGKFDTATEYLERLGVKNLVYDPYNRSDAHNGSVLLQAMQMNGVFSCTISNVLNVIAEQDERYKVLMRAWRFLKEGGTVYVTVYEGDRSGVGRQTGKDQWQNNKPLREYLQEVREVFGNAFVSKGVIVAVKEVEEW